MDLNSLEVLGKKQVGTGERDLVGFIDCRCGQVAEVYRGKARLYECCPDCGAKMANGAKNTQFIYNNMRKTREAVKAVEVVQAENKTPEELASVVSTVIKKAQEQAQAQGEKKSILARFLAIELFTL